MGISIWETLDKSGDCKLARQQEVSYITTYQSVAQSVARGVWGAEVAGSNPVTLTIGELRLKLAGLQ